MLLARQPGLRMGLVIADDRTLLYAPTAAVVEAGPNTSGGANGMILDRPPKPVEAAVGLSSDADRQIGRTALSDETVRAIKGDLQENPPQSFDITRRVRVFNAFIEFVELEVTGTELSRRTIPIPSHLLAVSDPQTQQQLRATFRLVPPGDGNGLSSAEVEKHRRFIERKYFHVIPRYGTVVLRSEKEKLIQDLNLLARYGEPFRRHGPRRCRRRAPEGSPGACSCSATGVEAAAPEGMASTHRRSHRRADDRPVP